MRGHLQHRICIIISLSHSPTRSSLVSFCLPAAFSLAHTRIIDPSVSLVIPPSFTVPFSLFYSLAHTHIFHQVYLPASLCLAFSPSLFFYVSAFLAVSCNLPLPRLLSLSQVISQTLLPFLHHTSTLHLSTFLLLLLFFSSFCQYLSLGTV